MKRKYNPFKPNSPVHFGMFFGRVGELTRTDEVLDQTANGNPTHILFVGERGIGKTSLLLVANSLARGGFPSPFTGEKHDFLTVQISLTDEMTLVDFAIRLKTAIERELQKEGKTYAFIKKAWEFIQKLEVSGFQIKNKDVKTSNTEIVQNLIYSIADTAKALTADKRGGELALTPKKDGIVILIDEADHASKSISLGMFLKSLTEFLVVEGCNKVLLVLAGLPGLKNVLAESHESSLRLFEKFELSPLTQSEVSLVMRKGIEEMNRHYPKTSVRIEDGACEAVFTYSEGYPHFVQQIGYSTVSVDDDGIITKEDVKEAMFMRGGALASIGHRYYEDLFYRQIKVDSYRRILKIMAKQWNEWVSKDYIKKHFKGKPTTLNNGIAALRNRSIILAKKGSRGKYRLQWASFAFWINQQRLQPNHPELLL